MKGSFFSGLKTEEYRDKLLFALALAVLAAGLFTWGLGIIINKSRKAPPSVIFTHWWQNDPENEILLEIKKEFEDLHKGISVVINIAPYEELQQELFDSADAVRLGDVLALDPLWVPKLRRREIIETAFESPLLSYIYVLYYNVGILQKAGFVKPPKTRSEFLHYAGTLAGDSALDKEDLIVSGDKLENFISGGAAFMIASTSRLRFVRERMGDDAFGITSVPMPDNYEGRSLYTAAGWTVGVNPDSVYREEARLFADFLAEKAPYLAEKTGALPGNGVFQSSTIDPFYSKIWDIVIAGEPDQDASGSPFFRYFCPGIP